MKKIILMVLIMTAMLALNVYAKEQEVVMLFTGETHAALYPCHCPIEPDGGVARRATMVSELRLQNPNTLLLDAGGFFAGGAKDQYAQNAELDKKRTEINLEALKMMGYDAVNVSDEELNFGRQFLEGQVEKTKIPFISSNLKSKDILPYQIKDLDGIKIAILGLTGDAVKNKAPDVEYTEPKEALIKAVSEVKKKGANIVVLLSYFYLGEEEALVSKVSGIDVLVSVMKEPKKAEATKMGGAIVVRPSWQGRRLVKLNLKISDKKIIDSKIDEIRLSDKVAPDPQVLKMLPSCFSDYDCAKKEGFIPYCQNPGQLNAACAFKEAKKIPLIVIAPKICLTCDTSKMVNALKSVFAGLQVSYLNLEDQAARKLIQELNINMFPVYILKQEVSEEKEFNTIKDKLELKSGYYIVKPSVAGVSYFSGREKNKGKLDIFMSLFDKGAKELIQAVSPLRPRLHLLAVKDAKGFDAPHAEAEIEEDLRVVCIMKHYPQKLWDYLACRSGNIGSSWWDECAKDMDMNKIRQCAMSTEGAALLEEDITLNKELGVMFGPTYLLNNQEIFASKDAPKTEALKKLIEAE